MLGKSRIHDSVCWISLINEITFYFFFFFECPCSLGLKRAAFTSRGYLYTPFATAIRCVSPDEHSCTVRLHYLTGGSARLAFIHRRQEYFLPLGLVFIALCEVSDKELQDVVCSGVPGPGAHVFASERVAMVLEEIHTLGIHTRSQALSYLGICFRERLNADSWETNIDIGKRIIRDHVFIHLATCSDKFNLLVLMLQKLYALVTGQCSQDNPDSLMHHEVLLPGILLQMFMREQLSEALIKVKDTILREFEGQPQTMDLNDRERILSLVVGSIGRIDLGRMAEYFLATGNLVSKTGLGLSQTSGFTIVADKLNYVRYLSHFRSIHRGAYYAELRTTTVRKLLPDSWGFLCPVHTPDGSPCGLLNHLTASCFVHISDGQNRGLEMAAIFRILSSVGVLITTGRLRSTSAPPVLIPVTLDGVMVGFMRAADSAKVVATLRSAKVSEPPKVPPSLEVVYIPTLVNRSGGAFPGLYLFTSSSRLMRPVRQLASGFIENISSLEQAFMSIKCPDGSSGGSEELVFTHEESNAKAMLSVIASCTPWSDYNQSPRNMYQCQMAKQTMGLPLHAFCYRPDTKLYRLQSPQRPIAVTESYDEYSIDEYPLGTNAVIAVLAYTGYDMEDAMIVSKGSMERGFSHATLYKTETLSLVTGSGKVFGHFDLRSHSLEGTLNIDGSPSVGSIIEPGSALASVVDRITGQTHVHKAKGTDQAIVDRVSVIQTSLSRGIRSTKMALSLRYNRNPIIGDKFSSRHGQKGVLSFLWPEESLPYVERTGIRPDIIINPHAFPSRMTIGMLVESMASKSGALDGTCINASPFKAAQKEKTYSPPAAEYGETLRKHGYDYCGSETMVNGLTGEAFGVDIYIGLVYYQRLRHMVSDKFQVRSVGPNNSLTQQPTKGRKSGGGIRFGEMERDALLAHGAAYLIHDRLHACSDRFVTHVCSNCGSILAPSLKLSVAGMGSGSALGCSAGKTLHTSCDGESEGITCRVCNRRTKIDKVELPFVFKYLASELAAMNIRIGIGIQCGA